jgi:UDP-N-acetylmuramoyl-tripeptide--D-alanyl-D-alanine ligase
LVLVLVLYKDWNQRPAADEKASVASIAEVETSRSGGFPEWLHERVRTQRWVNATGQQLTLDRRTVEESLRAGQEFLLKNQKPAGNFNYSYDFVRKRLDKSDHQVRQAGVLWVLALLFQQRPDPAVRSSFDRALDLFFSCTRASGPNGALAVAYPGEGQCLSGTVALTALGIIEYLQACQSLGISLEPARRQQLLGALDGYLHHLESMRLENQHFSRAWSWSKKERSSDWDPYTDGECLLCLVKAAKCLGVSRLVPQIESSFAHLSRHYTAGQWLRHPDSEVTLGFFQWGCMIFWEYRDTEWKEASLANDYLRIMGWWSTYVHQVLKDPTNTAADFEGLIFCWRAAKEANDVPAAQELAWTIDQGLGKLITWQVAGPLEQLNPFLRSHPTRDPLAVGGVLGEPDNPHLRIDVTEHHLHALMLARQFLWN